ncbi:MAG: coenzyme F420-0:L-glutamate ligase [Candidatus Parcubacteria bacterium]|nr:coenzyme F420-0:L-glutamate ligase [Candidatus Parcubacteria bacterium]
MEIKPIKTRVFVENEDLTSFILKYFKKIPEKSILVVTSKIVALSEGRVVEFKNKRQKIKLIKAESDFALKTKVAWMTIKDGMVMASAGIDESNAQGKLILLPKDSFTSAEILRKELQKKFKIKKLGVLITDSRTFPLRAGIVGVALGYAGFKGIRDYRGTRDIFGRMLKMTRTDVADSLATAAVLSTGEGKEMQPLALITNAPVEFTEKINKEELLMDPREDLYRPFFEQIKKMKLKK